MKDQELGAVVAERDSLATRLREMAQEMETFNVRQETNEAELKRLRTENLQQRERLTDVTRQKSQQDDERARISPSGSGALRRRHPTSRR